jgi:hypothetical protein
MDSDDSSYYPPRARRWLPGQTVDRTLLGVRRLFRRSPLGASFFLSVTGSDLLLSALVPSYGYARFGQRPVGRLFLIAWCVCAVVTVVFIQNAWITGWTVGGMASCHSSGLAFLVLRHLEHDTGSQPPLLHRIAVPLALWALYAMLIYWPAYDLFRNNVAMPLRITSHNRPVLINPRTNAEDIRRGDLIAFNSPDIFLRRNGQVPVVAKAGPMTGKVLGVAGDRIQFEKDSVLVNGHKIARSELMPLEGSFVVESGQWWVWPDVFTRINNGQGMDVASVSEAFSRISHVERSDFLGRAYGRWFFFRQDTR